MRKIGPVISAIFYFSQALHGYLLATSVGPRLREKYSDYEPVTSIVVVLGWILCWKVTYLYWRVSTKHAGSPKQNICHKKIKESDKIGEEHFNPQLPLDKDVMANYS